MTFSELDFNDWILEYSDSTPTRRVEMLALTDSNGIPEFLTLMEIFGGLSPVSIGAA